MQPDAGHLTPTYHLRQRMKDASWTELKAEEEVLVGWPQAVYILMLI